MMTHSKHSISRKALYLCISVLLLCQWAALPLMAQPDWVKKATKSVFTVKTFAADGSLIGSSNGFFVGTGGEAVSSFAPFRGAARAVVIDATGKEMAVSTILGANETYDVVKFRVAAAKTQPLTVAQTTAATGTALWLLPYRDTKNTPEGRVRKAETFMGEYSYYTVALTVPETAVSCPLLNQAGEVVGIAQQPAAAADTLSYAVSARFADSLKVTGLSLNDPALKAIAIKKELPDDIQQANLLIYLAGSQTDSATYAGLIDDFIRKFPQAADGYIYRAQLAAGYNRFDAADRDMQQAMKTGSSKENTLFNYARLIYQKDIYQSDKTYEPWTLDKALSLIDEAIAATPVPTYRQLKANILFAQKNYGEACSLFQALAATNLDRAEMWYAAARCREMQKDTAAWTALLDSTMSTFSKPYLKQAAPYLMARANAKMDCRKYREALSDLNDYEQLMAAQLTAQFYYIRSQAAVGGRLYQQALNDLTRAVEMAPKEVLYYAEKASLQVRVGQYDQAVATAEACIGVDPASSDGYLFKGLALCLQKKTKEGIACLEKARELGNPQAEGLIKKYQ